MDSQTRRRVRTRAANCCEYCQISEKHSPVARLQIEHIIPRKHGGTDDLDNLALACVDCNLHKGANLTGIDPDSGEIVELYHPRRYHWSDHFAWAGVKILGLTPTGRTTVRVLDMNGEDRLQVRLATQESKS